MQCKFCLFIVHQFQNLMEVADVVASSDKIADVAILPPDVFDSVSDKEAIDEDDLLPTNMPEEVLGSVSVCLYHSNEEEPAASSDDKERQRNRKLAKKRDHVDRCVTDPACHEVYFDNFFASYVLLAALRDMNQRATVTVRENRLKGCPLMDFKVMKKKRTWIL